MSVTRVQWRVVFWIALIVIAVIILVICGIVVYVRNAAAPAPTAPNATTTTNASGTVIHLLTPAANGEWTIGGANSITWDAAAGVTGEIELADATTKAPIGIIASQTDPNQTSYSWDARSVYLARFSADTKIVMPGTYAIRIHFDGGGFSDLVSGLVKVTNQP